MDARPKLAFVGIPYDANSSYLRGAASAPALIREAFRCESSNLWSETGVDLGSDGVVFDAGDLELDPDHEPFAKIEEAIARLLDQDFLPVLLGGDHSITYPIVKAFGKKYPTLHILHLDAHPDLYDELHGNRYSHACPFARILEDGLAERLVQVGVRTMNGHQQEQADRFGVEVHAMKDWDDEIVLRFDAPLYISVDLDVLDPAFAPGVSHHEPGGLTTRQVIRLIQRVTAPVIVGADIVEFNPERDPSGVTAVVSAKLLKEIAAKLLT